MIKQLLSNSTGKIILSIIWALGISSLFKKVCKHRGRIIYKGPNQKQLKKIYKYNDKCYKFHTQTIDCENSSF